MFWIFVLVAALAVGVFQLGAYSVWFVILKAGLLIALLVICGLFVSVLWQKVFARSKQGSGGP